MCALINLKVTQKLSNLTCRWPDGSWRQIYRAIMQPTRPYSEWDSQTDERITALLYAPYIGRGQSKRYHMVFLTNSGINLVDLF